MSSRTIPQCPERRFPAPAISETKWEADLPQAAEFLAIFVWFVLIIGTDLYQTRREYAFVGVIFTETLVIFVRT